MKIELSPYNPEWENIFEREKPEIESALAGLAVSVEYIGSTSVEGLGAKPVIDILVGIEDFNDANKSIPLMKSAGYNYVDKYEDKMPGRRYYTKTEEEIKFHIHLVEYKGSFWRRHILFRDYLREFDDARDEYYNLKSGLAEKGWDDKNDYTDAKTEFIKRTEREAEEYFDKKKIKFKRLNHIQICIPSGKEYEARKFYSDILGLDEIEKPAELKSNGGLWYRIADIELHLGVEDELNKSKRHPAFEVEDLAGVKSYLRDKNIRLKEEIQIPGVNRFSFFDPFGNRIEFLEKII